MKKLSFLSFAIVFTLAANAQQPPTYAEKLGYPKGARVIILHVDDAGMSHDSNDGVIMATSEGVANSTSVMMPCPWVSEFKKYLDKHPTLDAGLHLTLTSEWENYRWGPLAGKANVPGLVDKEGVMWPGVGGVYFTAKADEVDKEIRAQYDRALAMGFKPTHLDSHMGTLFAKESFMEKYIQLGIEKQVPVMFPGGEDLFYRAEAKAATIAELKKQGKYTVGMDIPEPAALAKAKQVGEMIWKNGLPVLDDLHNSSYDWNMPDIAHKTDKQIQQWYTDHYIESIGRLSPGLTMVIMHCTLPSATFKYISDTGQKRKGDLLAMTDPRLRAFLKQKGFILTTWREVMERRVKIGKE
ncbi:MULTISPECIES: polysaccharide deacetylase family protein [unclassified Mucilaginibacter]|uniref:polysaccharide deacetylase family protein n=1 Tax=unclassified Mucilaginibacter TaxID=2617802 RepID=UPI002AC92C89|nr:MULTISPECIES: polysaccharide deacetylase family protein [unclassified Mucilaginibacter]MEB0262177.1 polysaccharide deacetylase family protein [Mucilaginibacter sp. 10I4]MEB0277037.1 polysaccharide deacetylase family protein [Mucilaginibacter sp. 10B2]MEB0302650.1 polysaccharide deacetylase family protein [Mucilaginibacter sp. 5C4]WPX25138.1 polysaccharide deacetylase family protein [Mucilaginibacter sp. 5C4]